MGARNKGTSPRSPRWSGNEKALDLELKGHHMVKRVWILRKLLDEVPVIRGGGEE